MQGTYIKPAACEIVPVHGLCRKQPYLDVPQSRFWQHGKRDRPFAGNLIGSCWHEKAVSHLHPMGFHKRLKGWQASACLPFSCAHPDTGVANVLPLSCILPGDRCHWLWQERLCQPAISGQRGKCTAACPESHFFTLSISLLTSKQALLPPDGRTNLSRHFRENTDALKKKVLLF